MADQVWMTLDWLDDFGLGLLVREGVADYIQHVAWRDFDGFGSNQIPSRLKRLRTDPPAGWLGAFRDQATLDAIAASGIPAVQLASTPCASSIPTVDSDYHAVGILLAEYFYDCGIRHMAFYGNRDSRRSVTIEQGFTEAAGRHDIQTEICYKQDLVADATADMQLRPALDEWVRSISKPAGVFADIDHMARAVIRACHRVGVRVPEEVAVAGVDNMTLVCCSINPPLSSVKLDYRRIGYEAAALLDRLMRGMPRPTTPILIQPLEFVARQSSDVLAVDDNDVVEFVTYIRQHAAEAMSVGGILQVLPMSRRVIEKKFLTHLGHTPAREIKRAQIAYIKRLLENNDWPMTKIASLSAFSDARMLSIQFKKETGMTPSEYRRKHRSV